MLNALFHLEASPGNVAFSDFQTLSSNRLVALAVPIAVGDNYLGYRIVGTLTNLFTEAEAAPGRRFRLVAGGRWFEDGYREAKDFMKMIMPSHAKVVVPISAKDVRSVASHSLMKVRFPVSRMIPFIRST